MICVVLCCSGLFCLCLRLFVSFCVRVCFFPPLCLSPSLFSHFRYACCGRVSPLWCVWLLLLVSVFARFVSLVVAPLRLCVWNALRVLPAETRLTVYRRRQFECFLSGVKLRVYFQKSQNFDIFGSQKFQCRQSLGGSESSNWTPAVNRQPGFRREDS